MLATAPFDPGEIEEHYRKSPFIKEISVDDQLHAVVVPDRDALRARKIVNVRDLIRFELEGLSVSLPPAQRVLGFDVIMDPLPRLPADDHVRCVVATVRALVPRDVAVRADSNLELDLGLDSLERVELIAALEQRFGRRVPDEAAQCAFVVRDVAEAFRGATESPDRGRVEWGTLLASESPGRELLALLRPRVLTALFLFVALRVMVGGLVRPRVSGLERLPRRGPFIITPNHQSYLDPFVLMAVLPFGVLRQLFYVGATEYFESPLTSRLARQLNIVPVDPDANLLAGLQAGAFGLRHGKVLVVFPEGERSIDGSVKAFKRGAAVLAQELKVPIVPVAIDGMFEIWPRMRPLAWRRLLPWSRHHVRVQFGDAIAAEGRSDEELTARIRAAVSECILRLGDS
jgi:long-chain acyl-CoA synthetase